MKLPKKLLSWKINSDNSIFLTSDESFVKIYLLTDDIVRIRSAFENNFLEESYVLTLNAWDDRFDNLLAKERTKITAIAPQIEDTTDKLILKTNTLVVEIYRNPFFIQIKNSQQQIIYSDLKTKPYQQDSLGRVSHYQELDLDNDCFYGFGEKTGVLNKVKQRLVQNAKDTLGYDPEFSDPLYKHIPFYIKLNKENKHAVGFFYHNTYESVFDMGVEHSNYHHRYSYFCADGGDIDLFILNGPSIADVVKNYTDLTGKSAMLPISVLGYIGSTMYYVELPKDCDDEIIGFVNKCREEDIPIDNFHLSSGYTVDAQNKRQLFTWNTNKFNNPSEFFTTMHDIGVNVTPNIKPGVLLSNPNYAEMQDAKVFIGQAESNPYIDFWWGGLGSFFDFTSAKARQKWSQYLVSNLLSCGVTSLWNDNCEYDSLANKDIVCDFDGAKTKLAQVKSIQPNLMAFTGYSTMLEYNPNIRPYSVNRGGFAGIQRYSQTWAGDNYTSWKSLKFNIATILGMGLSGVANNGCDIGGFWGEHPDVELFVRWVQNGIFQPRFSIHSCNTDNTVTEPWMYHEYTHLIRDAIKLRYRLMPYLYSLMRNAHLSGAPIMRSMCYEFQEDIATYNQSVDFMFGAGLLVANVVEQNAATRKVYLPKCSTWYDFHTFKKYDGGQEIEIPVTLDLIPLFIRNDAIISLSNDKACLSDGYFEHVTLLLGGDSAKFALYQDDGVSQEYLLGKYSITNIEVIRQEMQTTIELKFDGEAAQYSTNLEIELINKAKGPFWVSKDGENLKQFLHRGDFEKSSIGWYYSNAKGSVEIKTEFPQQDCQIVVSFAHFDLIGM